VVLLVLSSNLPLRSTFIFGVDWTQPTRDFHADRMSPTLEESHACCSRMFSSISLQIHDYVLIARAMLNLSTISSTA